MKKQFHILSSWYKQHHWNITFLFVGILLPLVLFGVLADEIHEGESFSWDTSVLQFIRLHATPFWDWIFITAERTGGVITVPFLIAVILGLRFLKRAENSTYFAFAVVGAYVLNVLSKIFFQRERPSLWTSPLPESNYSFPSGHAMVSMAVAAAFIELAWSTKWRWPVVALGIGNTLAIGFSRLYLGVHYPSDVLAGWSAGLIWACGLYWILKRGRRQPVAVS